MTTAAPMAGVTPAPKSLPARFVGILFAPKETFQSLVPAPKVLGMLAVTAVLVGVFAALPMTTDAGKQAAIDSQVQQMKSFGFPVSDQMYDQMEKTSSRMPYTAAIGAIVMTPIISLIFAGILFAIFNAALGGEASFKQVFAVYIHGGPISVVSTALAGVVNYFTGHTGSVANLGALLPMLSEKSFFANLLGAVDVFIVWSVIVLAMGLGVLYKRRTQPIAISLLSVYAVIAIVIALLKSRGGA